MGSSPFNEVQKVAESGVLLTGDTLFVGTCGATTLLGGNHEDMLKTLSRLSTMAADVVVCPGHAYSDPWTTIGAERKSNDAMMSGIQAVPRPLALPPCFACENTSGRGPKGFYVGRKVRLCNFGSAPGVNLNGLDAALQGYDEKQGKYAVKLLKTREQQLLEPEHLEPSLGPAGPRVPSLPASAAVSLPKTSSSAPPTKAIED